MTLQELEKWMREHKPYVDEDNRIWLSVVCDSTALFLWEMVAVLRGLGCEDNRWHEADCDPYWQYVACGILPDGAVVNNTDTYRHLYARLLPERMTEV